MFEWKRQQRLRPTLRKEPTPLMRLGTCIAPATPERPEH
jgi:hypothetical protein